MDQMNAAEWIQRYQQYVHLVALATGVCLHLGYFQRGEHYMYGLRYLQAFTLLFHALTVALTLRHDLSWLLSIKMTNFIFVHLMLGLYGSLLCYRLVWHPLRGFPSPIAAGISRLWSSIHVRNGDAQEKYWDCTKSMAGLSVSDHQT